MNSSRLDSYRSLLSEDEFRQVLELLDRKVPTAVRLNPLKVDPASTIKKLSSQYGWVIEPVPFCQAGWVLHAMDTSPGQTLEYRNGHYYIQEASSMLPVEAFEFHKGRPELILDMAAAPGGKSTHLAARAGDVGLLVANDASRRRQRALSSNLRRWGAASSVVTNLLGERMGQWLPGIFDKVLLDAPCSGEGLRAGGGSKGRSVSEREREALQSQQIRMLLSGIDALKAGGQLVYATCTAAPEENEAVIQAALQARPDQVSLKEIDISEPKMRVEGLRAFSDQVFDPSMALSVRLWPFHFDTGAFFSAKLQKLVDENGDHSTGFTGVPPDALPDDALNQIHVQLAGFGFDLRKTCQESQWILVEWGRFVHAVSSLWFEVLPRLPVKEAGLPVGRWQGEVFYPAHEWVTRFDADFQQRRFTLDQEQTRRWLRGADLRDWSPPVKGGAILLQDGGGRFLGVGSVSAHRVRNLLPRAWVAG